MKKALVLFYLVFCFAFSKAQELNQIDAVVAQYPKSFNTSEELATLINKDFKTDTDKARAIYSWICNSVKFDLDAQFSKKKKKRIKYKDKVDRAQKLRKQRIETEHKALSKHLAVAEGYAVLYKRLCDLCGIYGYILRGTGKFRTFDIGKLPRMQNHYWNVVQIGKEWFFVDAMLGAGVVDYVEKTYQPDFNEKYFFTPPEQFFLNHFPKEQGWLKVEKSDEDFAKLPLFYGEYLKNEFELAEPIVGELNLQGADSVLVSFAKPNTLENFTYRYNYEKEPGNVIKPENGHEGAFVIPFENKRRGYLTLYYKEKPVVAYKIGTY